MAQGLTCTKLKVVVRLDALLGHRLGDALGGAALELAREEVAEPPLLMFQPYFTWQMSRGLTCLRPLFSRILLGPSFFFLF